MSWSLFSTVDRVLLEQEQRQSYASRTPRVWPSEASAELLAPVAQKIVGKCHRASFFRLIGADQGNPIDAKAARRFRTGRAMEEDLAQLCRLAGIFVASGVRHHVADIDMPLELDLVVLGPAGQMVIVENKTIYGYMANRDVIQGGRPKMENLLQAVIYGNEFRTGRYLKEVIRQCRQEMEELSSIVEGMPADDPRREFYVQRLSRYRMEVDWKNLEKASDGPVEVKIAYESRDSCETREFDIGIAEDRGEFFPSVNGEIVRDFTIRSIYDRFLRLQRYYWNARLEAEQRLKARGLAPEDAGSSYFEETPEAWKMLVEEMCQLGPEFWPPAEYEWRYSDRKIAELGEMGLIGKTVYGKWKKDPSIRIGDWQCEYCAYKTRCLPVEYPLYASLIRDLVPDGEEV